MGIGEEELRQYLKVNSTQGNNIVKELFVTSFETTSTCLNCTFTNKFKSEVYMISCALGKERSSVNLETCIDSFIHEKRNCVMCDSNNCNSESTFLILPKILFDTLPKSCLLGFNSLTSVLLWNETL